MLKRVLVGLFLGCACARSLPDVSPAHATKGTALDELIAAAAPKVEAADVVIDDTLWDAVVGAETPPDATLKGDWEAPDAVLLAYDPEWEPALETLARSALDDAPVYMLASPEDRRSRQFARFAQRLEGMHVISAPMDSPWVRDYGPIQARGMEAPVWMDFLYAPETRPIDDAVPSLLALEFGIEVQPEPLLLSGGAVISNGTGLCAITYASFYETDLAVDDPADMELFLQTVGCHTLALVPELPGESTAHVDMIAQFLAPDVLIIAEPSSDLSEDVVASLEEAKRNIRRAARRHGQKLRMVNVPLSVVGDTFYSYVNSFRTQRYFFVPEYAGVDIDTELRAYERLASVLPDVTIVPIEADAMIEHGGAVHCLTLGLNWN